MDDKLLGKFGLRGDETIYLLVLYYCCYLKNNNSYDPEAVNKNTNEGWLKTNKVWKVLQWTTVSQIRMNFDFIVLTTCELY